MIKIGDKVKCLETGHEGSVIARSEYLNGRIRFSVQSPLLTKDGRPVAPKWIEKHLLTVTESKSMSIG